MKFYLPLALSLTFLTACVSVHEGNMAKSIEGEQIPGMLISARELTDPGKESFSMVSFTIENKQESWLKIENVEVLIGSSAADKVSVVLGEDLKSWGSAMEARAAYEQHNDQMSQIGLAVLGGVAMGVGAGRGNSGMAAAGAAALVGSQAWAIGDAISVSRLGATTGKSIPDNHITQPFSVPGKMFLHRWLLLNKPMGQRLVSIPLAITTVDGKREVIEVKLK